MLPLVKKRLARPAALRRLAPPGRPASFRPDVGALEVGGPKHGRRDGAGRHRPGRLWLRRRHRGIAYSPDRASDDVSRRGRGVAGDGFMGSAEGRPTRVRFRVVGYLCSLAFILYVDRVCIGQAGTSMKRDLELSDTQWGLVGGAFMLSYGVFEVITGHWGDRFGSRRVLTRIVLWWSAFLALTGCVGAFF